MTKNKIAKNVLEEVTRQISLQEDLNSNDIGLVVFTGSNVKIREKIYELKRLKDKNLSFSLAFSFMASRILDIEFIVNELRPAEVFKEEDVFKIDDIVNSHSYIVGPNITINTLSKVALGIIDGFIPALIWTYLYRGKRTYLDYYSVRNYMGEPSKNNVIFKIIKEYLDTLESMGAIEIDLKTYDSILNWEREKDRENKSYLLGKVVTEKDLKNIPKGETLSLPKGTIITPLARDTAKLMGIVFKEEN